MKPSPKLKNGARVIEAHYSALTQKMTVVAEWQQNEYHPFVTWRVDEDGNAYLGHYFKTASEAFEDFQRRM